MRTAKAREDPLLRVLIDVCAHSPTERDEAETGVCVSTRFPLFESTNFIAHPLRAQNAAIREACVIETNVGTIDSHFVT